jgi:hypothetical protein
MLLIAIVVSAEEPPKLPMSIYGKVNVDGTGDLPADAKVIAKVDGDMVDEFEVNGEGWYGVPEKSRLIVPECDSFELVVQADGVDQSQGTFTWESGAVARIDLTYIPGYFPTPTPTATPEETGAQQTQGRGGGGGLFVPPQLPESTAPETFTEETSISATTPSESPAASIPETPEPKPTAAESAPSEPEEVRAPAVWWQQPTVSILFIAVIIGGIALILYFTKR